MPAESFCVYTQANALRALQQVLTGLFSMYNFIKVLSQFRKVTYPLCRIRGLADVNKVVYGISL